jgi:hypothetical protein
VEGAHLGAGEDDVAKHGIQVLEHVTRSNAYDLESLTSKYCVARSIAPRLVAVRMSLAVNFDDQSASQTREIGGDRADWKLPPEIQAIRALAQLLPE